MAGVRAPFVCAQHAVPVMIAQGGCLIVNVSFRAARKYLVLDAARQGWLKLSNSESPEFSGRVIAALYNDPNLMNCSGGVIVGAEAARRYGIKDIDGREPAPITLDSI